MSPGLDARGEAGLAERRCKSIARASSSRVRGAAAREHRRALSVRTRGERAARRPDLLQIVPPVDAGGDERATLAVTAALAETGARALVATDSASWPANCRRSAASSSAFRRRPRTRSRWPLIAPPAAHHRFGAGRPRPRALALGGLGGGQGLPQGETPACHLASWQTAAARARAPASRPLSPRATRHRVVRVCGATRGDPSFLIPQAPQDRPSGHGSLQASAGTGERAARVRHSDELERRGA